VEAVRLRLLEGRGATKAAVEALIERLFDGGVPDSDINFPSLFQQLILVKEVETGLLLDGFKNLLKRGILFIERDLLCVALCVDLQTGGDQQNNRKSHNQKHL